MKLIPRFVSVSLLLILSSHPICAVTDTVWDGSDGGWFDRRSWSSGMPSSSTNVVVPSGKLTLPSYSEARLLRVGAGSGQEAILTIGEGATLEIGSAGASLLGAGEGSRGELLQEGGRVIMGNDFYVGGFLASGGGYGHYRMQDGILRIHSGDLVLGGNTTGSSTALFEQNGGSVEVDNLVIGSERYRGMQDSNANRAEYSALAGSLTVLNSLKLGSDHSGGRGEVDAMLRVGSDAKVRINGGLDMFAGEHSRPVLSFLIDGDAPGVLQFSEGAALRLGGELQFELKGGVALLKASEFALLDVSDGRISGEFASVGNADLWRLQSSSSGAGISLQLNANARKTVLNATSRPHDSFISSSTGYVVLEGLQVGGPFEFHLNLDPGGDESLESLLEGFKSAGLDARIDAGKYILIRGVAVAGTMYFAWDFCGGLSPARISAVAL